MAALVASHGAAQAPAKPVPKPVSAAAPAAKTASASKSATAPSSAPAPAAKPQAVSLTLNAEQRAGLYKALAEAEQEGFAPDEFAPADLGDKLQSKDQESLTKAQEALVAGVLRYARAQHGLRSFHGDDWPKEWAVRPQPYDAERELSFAVKENKIADWLNGLPPPFARYRALKVALAAVRAEAAKPPPPATQVSKTGKGKRAKLASAKRAPAAATGDGAAKASGAAVLTPDAQIRSLIANMERWRWMPRNISPDRVEANSAAGLLQVFQNNQPTLAMKAAAGKPGDETPILISAIDSIVFNPAWHVPKSIAEDELYPKNRRNPGYFAKEGFISSKDSESGLLQKPGPKNALGQIKFDFKNPFAVYLHDTPAQSAFERSARNVSHGCVRVERPIDLAALLLGGTPDGSPEAIQQLIANTGQGPAGAPTAAAPAPAGKSPAGGESQTPELKTKRVEVPKPMQVVIAYWTAFAGDGGKVEFRKDVYDWDAKLLQLLAAGRASA